MRVIDTKFKGLKIVISPKDKTLKAFIDFKTAYKGL